MQFVKPTKFTEAIKKLGERNVVTSTLDSLAWSAVPTALRERALFSATIENARFLQRAKDALMDWLSGAIETVTLPDGSTTTALAMGSRAQFVRDMSQFAVAEGMGPLRPGDEGTIKDITSQKRLELIFDTQIRMAHDYGNWQQGMDPNVLDEFPAQRFIRVVDVKEERDMHRIFENQVALKTDLNFWLRVNEDFGVPWGPWAWGCGHDVEDVDRAEAEALGLIGPGQAVAPAVKDFNDRLQASATGLDPELEQFLGQAFGDQVEIKDGTISWKGGGHDNSGSISPAGSGQPDAR